jgi:hypothetical protein
MKTWIIAGLLAAPIALWAQEPKLKLNLDHLAGKAKETVEVTLDASMLQFASKFLSEKKPDEAEAKKLVSGLKEILVRSFEFDKPGQYASSDLESLRSQLRGPQWSRIVNVRSKADGESVDVFVRRSGDQIGGLVVIAAEPKELTVVSIDGPIRPEDLAKIGGQFGVPKIEIGSQVEVSPGGKKE